MRTIGWSLLHTNRVCVFDQETSSNRTCKPFSSFEVTRLVETDFEETLKIFEIFLRRMNHFATNSVINFVPNQTCECVYVDDNGFAAWQCRTFFIWRCRLPATAGRAFSRCHGRLPLASWFRWWRGMESMEKHGKLWGCMGRFIRLGKSLAKPGKRDHATAQGALPVSCSSCLARNQPVQIQQIWIRWIPIFFLLRVFGANPLHCLYFSQNKKKQRENLRLTENRWQKILASHLPVMPRKTSFSFAPLLDFVRFRGLRSCNAYNLWFRMPAAKPNGPTCLRWIAQRSCWRFLTSSKRWNDVLVAPMCDFWCW